MAYVWRLLHDLYRYLNDYKLRARYLSHFSLLIIVKQYHKIPL